MIAPDKHVIYPEKLDPGMPFGPACTDDRRPAMRAELDRRAASTIDGWAATLAARAAHPDEPLLDYTRTRIGPPAARWRRSGADPLPRA